MPNGPKKNVTEYQVRVYDGFDMVWTDVGKPCTYEDALEQWNKETKNGTERTSYADIDYYEIFPANTTMLYSVKGWPEHVKMMDNR